MRGVQIPLYKGKDECVLDLNSYGGITLLPTYNKLFEILIWHRLKTWWYSERPWRHRCRAQANALWPSLM